VEWAIHQGKAKNIDEAVKLALEFEAFQTGRRKRVVPRNVRSQKEVANDRNEKLIDDILGRLARVQSSDQGKTAEKTSSDRHWNKSGKCHYCGMNGHWKRECPKRKENEAKSRFYRENEGRNAHNTEN